MDLSFYTILFYSSESVIIMKYIPFDKHFVIVPTNNICIKDFLLIAFFTRLLISSKLIQTYTFKLSPNIGCSHLIVITSVVITQIIIMSLVQIHTDLI